MDAILKYAVVVSPLAVVMGGVWRLFRWLDSPEAVQAQLRKRSAWMSVANEFEQLGDETRAESYRKIADGGLAGWAVRADLNREWKWRGYLLFGVIYAGALTGAALFIQLIAPSGLKEWAAFVAAMNLLLAAFLGLVLIIIEQFWFRPAVNRAVDDYGARLRDCSLGAGREGHLPDSGAQEVAEAGGQTSIIGANGGDSLRGERMPLTPRKRGLDRPA